MDNIKEKSDANTPDRLPNFSGVMENIYLAEARVYIAGVLVPTTRVSITSTFNQPPYAEISMPAYVELMSLGEHDRIPVLVFVRETMVDCPEFILMFEGFVTQTAYMNSALQRTVTITAVSHLDILNDIHVKYMDRLQDVWSVSLGLEENQAMAAQGNGILPYPQFLLKYGLVTGEDEETGVKKEKGEPIQFPSDYLENVYAFVQKSRPYNENGESSDEGEDNNPPLKTTHGSALTEFYGKYARTYKFLDRFERLPYFDKKGSDDKYAWDCGEMTAPGLDGEHATMFPMIYGMQQEAVINSLSTFMSNPKQIPNQTLREILDFLYSQMEYEYLYITNPAYHGGTEEDDKEKEDKTSDDSGSGIPRTTRTDPDEQRGDVSVSQSNSESEQGKESGQKERKLVSSVVKPLFTDTMPPGCNVIYRSHCISLNTVMLHKGIPTRIKVSDINSPLQKLAQASGDFGLIAQRGLIDHYPSKKYEKFDPGDTEKYLAWLPSELLEIEKFTGPWIRELTSPPWLFYLAAGNYSKAAITVKNGEDEEVAFKVFFERYLRRQLLNSKYFMRQMNVQESFDPYITPGFPSVVFDNNDSGFAYAGHVVSVVHNISTTDVTTSVAMNFVRPLHEAVQIVIPNPLTMIQQVTHDEYKLSEIYQAILGTPVAARKKEDQNQDTPEQQGEEDEKSKEKNIFSLITGGPVPGADAITFKDLEELATETGDATHPNNNPKVAYKAKRRNVCTFDRYLRFMNMRSVPGPGPEGNNTPVMLFGPDDDNLFKIEDRRKIEIYQKEVVYDPIIPATEEVIGPQEDEVIPRTSRADSGEAPASDGIIQNAEEQKAKSDEEAARQEDENAKKKVVRVSTAIDVRSMLRNIAKREFEMLIYR